MVNFQNKALDERKDVISMYKDESRFTALIASNDNEQTRISFFFGRKMKIHNNKTKFNGNWFFGLSDGEMFSRLSVVSKMNRKDKSRSQVSELFSPASINVFAIILISRRKTHFSAIWYVDLCFFSLCCVCCVCVCRAANWIYSHFDASKMNTEKFQNGNWRSCCKNMFVMHAISDYYILFLFSCTWHFFLPSSASLLNCDGIIKL